ncbi:unnamed protein product [Brachionus calyciflorus]|uniref:G-protein coupled receptors family 1 profile domain-containing protein n=1 Tax=Brachionus calyciflorus TaxID=104777 RepID=A0A814J678_9BILA|nr:unnamed protein product [Brachionus calyciflorus]
MMSSLFEFIIITQHVIISVLGLIGNFLVLIVYKKKLKDNETITFIIIHLAITDFLCCALLIPINCYHELNLGKITSDFMCKFHSFLNIINITYSCLLMTLVAFERFFCIVYPFKRIVSKFRAKIILTMLFILCFCIGLAGCLAIGIYHKVYRLNLTNQTQSNESSYYFTRNDSTETLIFNYKNVAKREIKFSPTNLKRIKTSSLRNLRKYPRSTHDLDLMMKRIYITSENNPIKNQNLPSFWIPTTDCFPNDQIISIKYFPYIRLFQNLIVVICFTLIFIVYAFLCIVVSKRRHLKANRENYYKEILNRSKQNTNTKNEISISRNNSFFTCLSPQAHSSSGQNVDQKIESYQRDEKIKSMEEVQMNLLDNVNQDNMSKTSDRLETNIETEIHEDFTSDDLNNNKSTQTKSSAIVSFKKIEKKRKSTIKEEEDEAEDISNQKKRKSLVKNDKYLFSLNYSTKISSHSYLIANLKTAFMLFVVTVIMAIVYTPALLTSIGIIDYNPLHWNIIYINNAANPLIYSFLNSNFRKSLKQTLKRLSNRIIYKKKASS